MRTSNDLYVEYQKQRMRIEEEMAEQAKRELLRQQLQQDLNVDDNRLKEVTGDLTKGKEDFQPHLYAKFPLNVSFMGIACDVTLC